MAFGKKARRRSALFSDTEALEDMTQQIVRRLAAGDLLQRGAGLLQIEQRKFLGYFRLERGGGARQ